MSHEQKKDHANTILQEFYIFPEIFFLPIHLCRQSRLFELNYYTHRLQRFIVVLLYFSSSKGPTRIRINDIFPDKLSVLFLCLKKKNSFRNSIHINLLDKKCDKNVFFLKFFFVVGIIASCFCF